MTRGHPPYVAIGEAERRAVAWGYQLITVNAYEALPLDFVINDRGCISLVRVRRLKYPQYRIPDIEILCKTAIGELRHMPVPDGIYRQLWVRGPDRYWHRYLVLPDSVELLEDEDDGDDPAGGGVLPPLLSSGRANELQPEPPICSSKPTGFLERLMCHDIAG